ncbi:MAG TPA: rhodanese-like domain-containing protein [Candidatus Sulfotelmatobacter sp.]|nr:rhodanese-like domain-containing protein [Candidatus Sulfotelmatobacter sp.]
MPSVISVTELQQTPRGQVQLVDVRSPSEFASGHIPGAVNLPMDQIESRLNDLVRQIPIVLICQAGQRAQMTADLLAAWPQYKISVLEGGTNAWIQSVLPLVCCANTRWSLERQVRLIAGLFTLAGLGFAMTFSSKFLFLSGVVGLGLTFAGLTDICPMGILLAKMPWNRPRRCNPPSSELEPIE